MNEKAVTIVACMPLWASPEPPSEQKGCVREKCPKCDMEIWVSEKKREMRSNNPSLKIWCAVCAVNASKGGEIETIDILKRH